MSTAELLPIGELADRTGTTVATIRYYDELGLVPAVARVGGKRRFDGGSVGRVHFVRRAQRLGFSLDAVQTMLDDTDGAWSDMVAARRAELVEQRREIDAMIEILDEVVTCGCSVVATCPRTFA